jgi:uncharacterized protein YjiS (DUF1127 family)
MVAVNLVKADRAIGQSLKHRSGAFLWQLIFVAGRFNPRRLFRQLQYETRRNETIRELNLLSDHYLDDVGARRSVDRRADDLVKRLRMGG